MAKKLTLLRIILCFGAAFCTQPSVAQENPTNPSRSMISYQVTLSFDGEAPAPLLEELRRSSRLIENQSRGARSRTALNSSIQSDIHFFSEFLRSEGYYAQHVDYRVVPNSRFFDIELQIHLGPRFSISDVQLDIVGDQAAFNSDSFSRPIISGAPARSEDIILFERALIENAAIQGYPFATIDNRDVVVDHATNTVQVTYIASSSNRVTLGQLQFQGLTSVNEDYIRRLAPWDDGDIYAQDKIDLFKTRLMDTGLFSEATIRLLAPDRSAADTPLAIDVVEAPHRTIALGGGYSTSEGFGAEVSWQHRNLLGRQEQLNLIGIGSEIEQSLGAYFIKPHFKRLDQQLSLSSLAGRENTEAFEKISFEAAAAVERKISNIISLSAGVEGEVLTIKESSTHDEFIVVGTPLSFHLDTSNDALDPHSGYRSHLTVKPSLLLIEANKGFVTIENRSSAYFSFTESDRVVFAVRSRLGAIVGADLAELPASERFFAGGGGSVRGFAFQALGAKDVDGDPIGGRSVAEISIELRTALDEKFGIVPFVEGGNIYAESTPDFSGFRWGAGLGLRYLTGFAPIRFDVATPINRQAGEARFQFYISLSQSF